MNSELYHYGVKGMKWGIRKDRRRSRKRTGKKISRVSYDHINAIYKSMDSSDRLKIDPDSKDGQNYFKSYDEYSKRTAYNGIEKDGFVIAEKIPDAQNIDGTRGVEIGIGVISKGRGTGTKLVSDMVGWFNDQNDYDVMWWPTSESNASSKRLAVKSGFIKDPLGPNYVYAKPNALKNLGIR